MNDSRFPLEEDSRQVVTLGDVSHFEVGNNLLNQALPPAVD